MCNFFLILGLYKNLVAHLTWFDSYSKTQKKIKKIIWILKAKEIHLKRKKSMTYPIIHWTCMYNNFL